LLHKQKQYFDLKRGFSAIRHEEEAMDFLSRIAKRQRSTKLLISLLLVFSLALLTGCGGGDVQAPAPTGGGTTLGGGGGTTVGTLSMSALTAVTNPLPPYGTTTISVTVLEDGLPATSTQTVDFTSTCFAIGRAVISPLNPTTNASGIATMTYTDNGCGGPDSITASIVSGPSISGNLNVLPLNISVSFGSNPLSAFGTTSVNVDLTYGAALTPFTSPTTVSFTSTCSAQGRANLPVTAPTSGGTASATYTDIGCGGDDDITVSTLRNNSPSQTGTLTVNALTMSPLVSGISPVPAFGNTTIDATLLDGGIPTTSRIDVDFSSYCADLVPPKASITSTAPTISGTARATYTDLGCGTTDLVTASVVNGPTRTMNLPVNTLTISAMTFGASPLSAFGATTAQVTVFDGGIPTALPFYVNFTSICAANGAAIVSPSVPTFSGIATANYTDNGCGAIDTVTATVNVNAGPTSSGNLTVNPLTMSNLTFDSDPISAFGNTLVHVDLLDGVTPYNTTTQVDFSSVCESLGLATISSPSFSIGGTATARYDDLGCSGQDIISASVAKNGVSPINGVLTISPVTMDPPVFATNPLPPYSSTTVSVTVREGGVPTTSAIQVSFSSGCSDNGKASITSTAVTNTTTGTATVTYVDNGCGAPDTITASLPNGLSTSGTLTVNALSLTNYNVTNQPLSPYGSTTVTVDLLESGLPYSIPTTVHFESYCANNGGRASFLTNDVITNVTGTATATYTDIGCNNDLITVTVPSIPNGPTLTGTLTVTPLTFSPITITTNPLEALSTTTISVTLLEGGVNYSIPTAVQFDSACNTAGFAEITPQPVQTVNGVATATYKDIGCTGDDWIFASLPNLNNSPTSQGAILSVNALSMTPLVFGVEPLSAFGTTTAEVNLQSSGVNINTPVQVNFTSTCEGTGKASIDTTVTTVNGLAIANYTDNGCANDDLITASFNNLQQSDYLTVGPPDAGSLQFISADPTTIALRNTGGVGASDTSQVKFKVLNTIGAPMSGRTVNFTLTTSVGGIYLQAASAVTNALGEASAYVHSGTIGTPVRVTASTVTNGGLTIYTQSEQLTVSTGLPDFDSFSITAESWNPARFCEENGVTLPITIYAADHFNNPVPDGTSIYFTSECGTISPSCNTVGGSCVATLTSTSPRSTAFNPYRCTILAYAIGEESFVDMDGDGLADPGEYTNMGEAWLDLDGSNDWNLGEPFIDYNSSFNYDLATADTLFNGVLCNETPDPLQPGRVSSPAPVCSSQNTLHVFEYGEMHWSCATLPPLPLPGLPAAVPGLASCSDTVYDTLNITDYRGNSLSVGSTVTFSTTDNFTVMPPSITVPGVPTMNFNISVTGNTDCIPGDSGVINVAITPTGGATATDTININATPNLAPIAVGDNVTAPVGSAGVWYSVLSNDSDPEGTPLTIISVGTGGTLGTVFIASPDIIYVPNAAAVATDTDSFTYTISDGYLTDTATVNVTITP